MPIELVPYRNDSNLVVNVNRLPINLIITIRGLIYWTEHTKAYYKQQSISRLSYSWLHMSDSFLPIRSFFVPWRAHLYTWYPSSVTQ